MILRLDPGNALFRAVLWALLFVAGAGFCAVVILYLFSFRYPAIGDAAFKLLMPGLFAVWLPTVLISGLMVRDARQSDFWKVVLSGCPPVLRRVLGVVVGLAVVNFVLSLFVGQASVPGIRFAAGHLAVFYGAAFCTLYSALHRPSLMRRQLCPNGHLVARDDSFCPRCGAPVESTVRQPEDGRM